MEAARKFLDSATGASKARFEQFRAENGWWLEDFVLYDTLRERYRKQCWNAWPPELARREADALQTIRAELASEMAVRRVIQFFFYEQWHALRLYCAQKSIRVVGDIAIFVDYDSVDVWANRELFRLKRRPGAGGCFRRASRRVQRHRAALGKSSLRLGSDARGRLQVVGAEVALGYADL